MYRIHRVTQTIGIAIAVLTVACNSVLGIDDVSLLPLDAGMSQSAPPDALQDCKVASSFGSVMSSPSTSSLIHRDDDGGPSLLILLNTEPRPDALLVLLYNNMGGHDMVDIPGSHLLNSADSKIETCGICAIILADIDFSTNTIARTFFALGQGTLQLSKADMTGLAGRLQNLKFRRVDTSGGVTREINDGCMVAIDDVQFDLTYTE